MSLALRLKRPLVLLAVLSASLCLACHAHASPEEMARISELLGVRPGMMIADVGAGDGEWTEELARLVGSDGGVFATEVDEDDVEKIRDRVADAKLDNVRTILGGETETGLPDSCCDAILLRLVYHHLTDPAPIRESLHRALRPGGLLLVVDIEPQKHWRHLDGVPERSGGHGILPDDLVDEIASDGFELVARYDDWPGDEDHFCAVFRRESRQVFAASDSDATTTRLSVNSPIGGDGEPSSERGTVVHQGKQQSP